MTDKLSSIASKSLGDSTSYAVYTDKFDSSLLNPMPRSIAREGHGIKGDEWTHGKDMWTCHEATFLLDNGLPVSGTFRFIYDASSELMIESKSAKLYFNSFDMCKMGKTEGVAIINYQSQIKEDLERVLKTKVDVQFSSSNRWLSANHINPINEYSNLVSSNYEGSQDGMISREFLESMTFSDYEGRYHHLDSVDTGAYHTEAVFTNALRSRCRHTKQKDTGLAAIRYHSTRLISSPSILKQIVSLREVNEFHEFCAEKLFVEFNKHLNPNDCLSVMLLYSRRGSLDINPIRWKGFDENSSSLCSILDVSNIISKVQGQ